jgi:hypothetical protein
MKFDQARRHLLLSFPNLESSESGNDAVDHLVEGAIHHLLADKSCSTMLGVVEVVAAIKKMAGLDYESAEIITALERLSAAGNIDFKHEEKRAFILRERRYRQLCEDHTYREERLRAVRSEWFEDLRLRHQLDDQALTELWSALDIFIAQLMNGFAAEAAWFLYQSEDGGGDRFAEVVEQRTPQIADVVSKSLLGVARAEFPRFLDARSAARTDYLAHRLRGAFVFHLLSVDPAASALMRENVADKTFYLDTNFLFRLFGFNGPTLAYGPQTIVSMSKDLNCRMVVAEETLHEFIRSLRAEIAGIQRHPVNHDSYRQLIANHPGDEYSFMQAYYREYLGGRVKSADEFERKYSNVERLLSEYGIEVDGDAELVEEEEASDEFKDLVSAINSWTNSKRPYESTAHDAFLMRLIRQHRGRRDKTAGSVKVWFLTYDRGLTAFSARRAKRDQLPPCLLASDWLQISRPFLPRTADYDRSFVAMLRYPVAFDDPSVVPLEQMVEALNRLDNMRELPTPVIAAMVSDREIVRRIRKAKDEADVKQLVEVESAAYARRLETSFERLEQDSKMLGERVSQLAQTSEEHRRRSEVASNLALQLTKERDQAAAELERVKRDAMDRESASARSAEQEMDRRLRSAIAETVTITERGLRAEFRTALRRVFCAVMWIAVVTAAGLALWLVPSARTPLGWAVTTCWLVLLSYALIVYAQRGRAGGMLSRSADYFGVIGFALVTLQCLGLLPNSPGAARESDAALTTGVAPDPSPENISDRGGGLGGPRKTANPIRNNADSVLKDSLLRPSGSTPSVQRSLGDQTAARRVGQPR